jgi:hypothetical protein
VVEILVRQSQAIARSNDGAMHARRKEGERNTDVMFVLHTHALWTCVKENRIIKQKGALTPQRVQIYRFPPSPKVIPLLFIHV